jgi:hypothetical protein
VITIVIASQKNAVLLVKRKNDIMKLLIRYSYLQHSAYVLKIKVVTH